LRGLRQPTVAFFRHRQRLARQLLTKLVHSRFGDPQAIRRRQPFEFFKDFSIGHG